MEITLKRWIFDKIQSEAARYNRFIDTTYVDGYYADTEKDQVTAIGNIIKETEKAIQIEFSTGSIDGNCNGWKAWVPKSQIVKEA